MTATVKILFVDDEPNVLKALRRLFLDYDQYEVLCATSGGEGLELLAQQPDIRVVVSDYRMPQMNGVEFLREVNSRLPQTVRIVLSGFADAAAVVEAINVGHIYKFIPKPWNDDELRIDIANAVETALLEESNRQLRRELEARNSDLQTMNRELEKLVQQRTESLQLRSQVLQLAQDILDSLPIGVLGIDRDEQIVHINSCAIRLLARDGRILLGEKVEDHLPTGLLAFIEQVKLTGSATEEFGCGQQLVTATGSFLDGDRRRGLIITLTPRRERIANP
ncbi:MAG: response regulator [Desulfuromonas thiophila]|nr:response regulator [Desulfuromonas thiophila]